MGKIDEDADAKSFAARGDGLGGGLDEEAGPEDSYDPSRREAAVTGDGLQHALWLSEQHDGLRTVSAGQ